jgi:hypothetical protein
VCILCGVIDCGKDFLLTLFIFACREQASRLVGPAQALSTYFDVRTMEIGVITLSSSDTEEALDLLSLCPTRRSCS